MPGKIGAHGTRRHVTTPRQVGIWTLWYTPRKTDARGTWSLAAIPRTTVTWIA